MNEETLWQIKRQINLQAGKQMRQTMKRPFGSLSKIDWHEKEQISQVSSRISGKTGMPFIHSYECFDSWHFQFENYKWSKEIAEYLAKEDNVKMTEAHWEVINFMREYYEEYKNAPTIKMLVKAIWKKHGLAKGNPKYLYELFPSGLPQVIKIAGVPRPTGDPF